MRSFSSSDYEAKQLRALKKQSKQLRNLRKGHDGLGRKESSGQSRDSQDERQGYSSESWAGFYCA